jgi:ribosomal-protein-serine acetyltransferase
MFQRSIWPGAELRQFELKDAAEVFAAVERNRSRIREWLPWVDRTRSADDIRDFIRRATEQAESNLGPQSAIWVNGVFAGAVGVHPINWPDRSSSIGYWLDAAYEGRGLITRACQVLLHYLFEEMRLHRVEIRCGTGNHRSCAVPRRLGFIQEGIAREAQWVNNRWIDLAIWRGNGARKDQPIQRWGTIVALGAEWRRAAAGRGFCVCCGARDGESGVRTKKNPSEFPPA